MAGILPRERPMTKILLLKPSSRTVSCKFLKIKCEIVGKHEQVQQASAASFIEIKLPCDRVFNKRVPVLDLEKRGKDRVKRIWELPAKEY